MIVWPVMNSCATVLLGETKNHIKQQFRHEDREISTVKIVKSSCRNVVS